MSSAFTKEVEGGVIPDFGERPVSPHRNLVTPEGLAMMDAEIAFLHESLAKAESEKDREHIALASRDLRYWSHRRETAEVSEPDPDSDVVRFGMTVQLVSPDGTKKVSWRITGEDEADAKHGKILPCLADGTNPVRKEGRRHVHFARSRMGNRRIRLGRVVNTHTQSVIPGSAHAAPE